jgi:hypothetical protein
MDGYMDRCKEGILIDVWLDRWMDGSIDGGLCG